MKYHLITIAILLVALAFYTLGYSTLGGIAFETVKEFSQCFWYNKLHYPID